LIWLIFQVEGCYFWLRKNTAVLRRFYRLIRIRSHSFMSHTCLSKRDIYLSKETYIRQEMSTETYTHQKETYIHQKRPLHDVIHTHSVSFIHVAHIFIKKRRMSHINTHIRTLSHKFVIMSHTKSHIWNCVKYHIFGIMSHINPHIWTLSHIFVIMSHTKSHIWNCVKSHIFRVMCHMVHHR
jgi:hypothetical protein